MKAIALILLIVNLFLFTGCNPLMIASNSGTTLNLSRKNLKEIPAYVFERKDLKVLKLYGNFIDSISYRIAELENLEELYIGRNNLKSFPNEIGKLKNLKILSAQYNEIDSLPSEIGQLDSLDQLILNQNELRSLPNEIGQLKKLEMLQLKFNRLDSLPETIGNCENLRFLYLNRNNLKEIPESVGKISQLREIYLSGAGQLVQLPESFCELRLLDILEVDIFTVIPICLLVQQTTRLTIIQK